MIEKRSKPSSVNKVAAMEVHKANSTTIKTSLTRVTPSTVLVKGPRARISLIMAMADDGARAARMVAPSRLAAILASALKPAMKGMKSSSRKIALPQMI